MRQTEGAALKISESHPDLGLAYVAVPVDDALGILARQREAEKLVV